MISRERGPRTRIRKRYAVLIGVVILSSAFLGALIIPLYTYPGADWTSVVQAKEANPSVPMVVIINPDNGPGSALDSNYVTGINQLRSAGVIVLGYDHTSYGARSTATVEADMNSYKAWYPNINGYFFDEMAAAPGYASYYSSLTAYALSQGYNFTVGNPGAPVDPSYDGTVSVIVVDENQGLPSNSSLASWADGMPSQDVAAIAYGVSPSSLTTPVMAGLFDSANYVYVTSETTPNPYASLGTDWTSLVSYLSDHVSPPSSLALTVQAANAVTGTPIAGIYTTIQDSSGTVATGYTPLTQTISAGVSYTVTISNYGTFVFDKWAGTGSTSLTATVDATQATTLTADYGSPSTTTTSTSATTKTSTITTTGSHSSTTSTTTTGNTASVTVNAVYLSGTPLSGTYTTWGRGTTILSTGHTPNTFSGTIGGTYILNVANDGNIVFCHWQGGSTNPAQTLTLSGNTALTAYYSVTGSCPNTTTTTSTTRTSTTTTSTTTTSTTTTSTTTKSSTTSSTSKLTINSVDQNGKSITGLWTLVQSSTGTPLTTGYTPLTFTGTVGSTYEVTASSYGPYTFTGWSNGNTSPTQSITLSGPTATLTAEYSSTA